MTALIAYGPIAFLALLALVAWVLDHFRSTLSVAEMVDQALDSGDAPGGMVGCCHCGVRRDAAHADWCPRAGWDLAESVGVMSDLDGLPGLDGSHDNLDDADPIRWADEVMWLTEMYEADEVPIIPGRPAGEAS